LEIELYKQCIDMRNKTDDLLTLREWLGHAAAVVGIDGGTLHLAATTEVPIVYGCTRVEPFHRSIVRNDEYNWRLLHVTPRDLECAGCQSKMFFMFKHNFANCVYGDNKCTTALRGEDFIEALEELIW
jgi:ADP-heptose:LPS heptosyltransferase